MMPQMNGYHMLEHIRTFCNIPVIFLTAKGEQMSKIMGFTKGCDDYVVKPFDFAELSLRIQAVLKRYDQNEMKITTDIIHVKDLSIDIEGHCVKKGEKEIDLTKKEYEILRVLSMNRGKVYSTKLLYELIWNDTFLENDNSVITHVRNLREKIGDRVKEGNYIKTIWGAGYKIEKED